MRKAYIISMFKRLFSLDSQWKWYLPQVNPNILDCLSWLSLKVRKKMPLSEVASTNLIEPDKISWTNETLSQALTKKSQAAKLCYENERIIPQKQSNFTWEQTRLQDK